MTACVRACLAVCVMPLYCFSAWGLIRPACPRLHDVGKWSWQCLWSPMTQTHSLIHLHSFSHIYNDSCTHTSVHTYTKMQEVPRLQALKCLWIIVASDITLHILSEDSWGICAYSHNRHRSPDTHTCPGLKAATQTVPCDVFCITLQSEIKPEGFTDTNTNEFILCSILQRSIHFMFYSMSWKVCCIAKESFYFFSFRCERLEL